MFFQKNQIHTFLDSFLFSCLPVTHLLIKMNQTRFLLDRIQTPTLCQRIQRFHFSHGLLGISVSLILRQNRNEIVSIRRQPAGRPEARPQRLLQAGSDNCRCFPRNSVEISPGFPPPGSYQNPDTVPEAGKRLFDVSQTALFHALSRLLLK